MYIKGDMPKQEDKIKMEGTITESLPNTWFLVLLQNGVEVRAYPCGKMRMNNIRLCPGDGVVVHVDANDLSKGIIIRRK